MTARFLVDTNVLVYLYDARYPDKQARARDVIQVLIDTGRGVLSAQVLSEFFSASTHKFGMSPELARARLAHYTTIFPVLDLTARVVLEAARGVIEHRLNFWDAQLWAVAYLNQIPVIFSEDFQDQSSLSGVRTVNPFHAKFRFESWIQ